MRQAVVPGPSPRRRLTVVAMLLVAFLGGWLPAATPTE
jgi:hypothetical protein